MISEQGFSRPTYEELRSEFHARILEKLPQEQKALSFEESTNIGRLSSVLIYMLATAYESIEVQYLSSDPNSATGFYLERLLRLRGISRLGATFSIVKALCTGTEDTSIFPNSGIGEVQSKTIFSSRHSSKISSTSCYWVTLLLKNWDEGTIISFNLNSQEIVYIAKANETPENVFTEIENSLILAGFSLNLVKDSENSTLKITTKNSNNCLSFSGFSGSWFVESVGTLIDFYADVKGSIFVLPNTVTDIKTPIIGWDSVTNPFGTQVGRNTETDAELRERFPTATVQGNATDQAIENKILTLDGVTTVRCISNRTDELDAEGRPRKSFEVIVVGGENRAIAQSIQNAQPSGISSFGNVSVNVPTNYGDDSIEVISFSRPEVKIVAVRVTISPYTEEGQLPLNYEFLIKKSLLEYAVSAFTLGKDFIHKRLYAPLYKSMDGIGDIVIAIGLSSDLSTFPSISEQDIPIASREIASFNSSLIEVKTL